ncbi:SCO2322 family protein [Streptomyces sp. NPDC005576]|uniref:SCO2322 family protein n=1 Tax=Streptomyces sp. NPDC005576 TaxID=3364726 RepID=UPI00369260D9
MTIPGFRSRPGAAVRRVVVLALFTALAAAVSLCVAGTAQAAGYRYWSFWEGDGAKWAYATQGPSLVRPDDGAVQGFRFAVSEDSGDAARPRRAPDFAAVCGDTPAKDGSKRVALVIDPGTAADAPAGEQPPALRTACARVAPDASTAEALASVAKPLRYDSAALLCAISGYPETGCGEQIAGAASPAPAGTSSSGTSAGASAPAASADGGAADGDGGGPSVGVLAGVGAVVVLGGAAVFQARRRR